MNDRNLKIWAEQCVVRGEAGDRSVRGQPLMVAMGILRLLGEKENRLVKSDCAVLGEVYHDLCAVLGWAVDDSPATVDMVARAARQVARQFPSFVVSPPTA